MPELPNDQPHQPPKQSHTEDHTEQIEPQAEKTIAEEQAGFRAVRSTTEQIFNLQILCEQYLQHQQDICHVFIDFKKAFDRFFSCNVVDNHEELQHQRQYHPIHQKPL